MRGTAAALALALAGCAGPGGIDLSGVTISGGLHDILELGISVTIVSIPTYVGPKLAGGSETRPDTRGRRWNF